MNDALAQHKPRTHKKKKVWNNAARKARAGLVDPTSEADLGSTVAHPNGSDGTVDAAAEKTPDDVNQKGHKVLAFLAGALSGSASAPLVGAGTTLLLAMDAPAAAVRALVISSNFSINPLWRPSISLYIACLSRLHPCVISASPLFP